MKSTATSISVTFLHSPHPLVKSCNVDQLCHILFCSEPHSFGDFVCCFCQLLNKQTGRFDLCVSQVTSFSGTSALLLVLHPRWSHEWRCGHFVVSEWATKRKLPHDPRLFLERDILHLRPYIFVSQVLFRLPSNDHIRKSSSDTLANV